DPDPAPPEGVGNLLRGDRAVQLAALADLDPHRERRTRDSVRADLRFLALSLALVFATRDVVLPGPVRAASRGHGKLPRNQEVLGVSVGDGLELAALAELVDIGSQDHLHALEPSFEM